MVVLIPLVDEVWTRVVLVPKGKRIDVLVPIPVEYVVMVVLIPRVEEVWMTVVLVPIVVGYVVTVVLVPMAVGYVVTVVLIPLVDEV